MLAVNTAIVTIEPISHKTATTRPGRVRGPKSPVTRCVIATVDHQIPELNPFVTPPPTCSLWRRSKSQTKNPPANAKPTKDMNAWANPNDVKVWTIGNQLASPPDKTAIPSPVA